MMIATRLEIRRRTIVVGLAVGVPMSVALLYRASRGLDLGRMWEVLSNADVVHLAVALVMMSALYMLQAERWHRIARAEGKTSYCTCLAFVLCGVAVNNVVPGRPGEALRGFWLARTLSVPVSRGFGTVLVDRASDVIVLLAALLASVPFVKHPAWLWNILVVGIVLGLLLMTGLVLAWWYASRSRVGRARAHMTAVNRGWLRRQLSGLVRSVAGSLSGRAFAVTIGLSAGSWLCAAFAAWLIATGLRIPLSLSEATFVTAVLNLGSVIPSSPGFIGTHQWLSVASLGLFAINRSDAFAFSVMMQAIWIVPTTLAGAAVIAVVLLKDPFHWRLDTSTGDSESSKSLLFPLGPQ